MNDSYKDTVFHGPEPTEGWPKTFAIVTACNPDGKTAEDTENESATRELSGALVQLALPHRSMTGGSPDGKHQEPGYLVECDLSTALELGVRFQQEAIFWIEDGQVSTVACSGDLTKQPVDTWAARYKSL